MTQHNRYIVRTFYRFVRLENLETLQQDLLTAAKENNLCGTILLAPEGVNATIAGSTEGMEHFWNHLISHPVFAAMEYKESFSETPPFKRLKVRLKKEIISFYQPQVDPTETVGEYVEAKDWNTLIQDPECLVLDTRNDYEVKEGTFQKAVDPHIQTFKQFADYVESNCDPKKHKKIAMFCTGGIRCEKASSYMKQKGFEKVYHLRGGILKYLEEIPTADSLWNGECYIFDEREALAHGLTPRQKK